MKKRVLSGIRATGRLHLGNYLGAVKGMLELQNNSDYETLYMVADVHTITTPYHIEELRKNRREVILDYLAAGLDPEKSIIFQQSEVPEHLELAFYFSSVVTIAKMQHLPTFKEKVKQYPQHATLALLNYPVLMAADIMLYRAGLVPVGIDQEPHLEVAREIARRFNKDYGTDFPEPVSFQTQGKYVPSLTGEGKMSKSVEGSYINLTDDLETIKSKIAKISTDSGKGEVLVATEEKARIFQGDKNYYYSEGERRDGIATLMSLIELFEGQDKRRELEEKYQSIGLKYDEIKQKLSEAIFNELKPIQEKRQELENNPEYVNRVISDGAEKARKIAQETIDEVRKKMGLK